MRKLVLKMSISIDGLVCGPNGEIDWLLLTTDQSALDWIEQTLWQAWVPIMGSRTFHDMASYWPTSFDQLAAPMNEIPKIVFSKKGFIEPITSQQTTQALKDAKQRDKEKGVVPKSTSANASSWTNATIANLVADITKLKKQNGKFILAHGGASFAQDLVKHGLIDEYRLVIHPVILGKGIPLFASTPTQIDLHLESSTTCNRDYCQYLYSDKKIK